MNSWFRRRAWIAAIAGICATAGLLVACGGGVGTGGTGSFAAGPITGFGSVIVNDIRFDDSAAAIEDGDGSGRQRAELRLGMTVEVEGGSIQAGSAKASRIRFDAALVGPVDAVDPAQGRLSMLGQTVTVDDTTVFDARLTGRLMALAPGQLVEVYALYDPALQRFRATRIEPRTMAMFWRIRGVVSQLDTRAQTLRLGGATFGYTGALGVPADLADGRFVRLTLRSTAPVDGRYSVAAFTTALHPMGELDEVVLKGLITVFVSKASFQVDGRPVDASGAQLGGEPALGLRVEVEGAVRNGVLHARKVELRSDDQERDRGFELRGTIESVDVAQRSFVLRGLTVSAVRSDLIYKDGKAEDLFGTGASPVGRQVEVHGQLSANGSVIEATLIEFD